MTIMIQDNKVISPQKDTTRLVQLNYSFLEMMRA